MLKRHISGICDASQNRLNQMMKTRFLIVFFLTAFAVTAAIAQKKALFSHPFHPNIKTGTVLSFLEELNIRSGVIIEYASNSFDVNRIIELEGSETTVGAVLKKLLEGQHVKLLEKNNKLILVKSASIINTDELVPEYTFYGFVKAANSLEPMVDATLIDLSSNKGIITNPYGYFSLSLPEGRHRVEISYVGYNPQIMELTLKENTRADIELYVKQEAEVMQEIVVPVEDNLKKNAADKINSGKYESYNYLLGENDPLRSAYLLPGVLNIPASFNGMFVRGGGADENLFLMDGNVIYNPTHMLGALSIVNQTSVKSMRLYKSDFPSKFGGATSSVIDIYTKDGNMEQWQGEANAGTLAGSFTLEGPLVKNKTAVMGSFRHSWITPLFTLFQTGIKPNFYDAHFKATQLINRNNKLMLNFYSGHDEVRQTGEDIDNLHKWGNKIASLGWNRVIGSRSFIHTSVNMSRYHNLGAFKYTLYDDDDDDGDDDDDVALQSGSVGTFSSTEQYNIKSQSEIYLNNKTKLNFGVQLAHTIIKPFETKFSEEIDEDESSFTSFTPLPFDELSAYGESEIKIGKKIFVRPGLHFSAYQFRDYRFYSFQPRFFTSYKIAKHQQLFASYSKMTQYLHLVTNPYLGVNADMWVPSTGKLQPEQSDSYNLSYSINHKGIKISVEGYWKELRNVTNYAEGKSYFVNNETWEQSINTGNGRAYGIEWMLQKTIGKLTFLGSYTLAWSWRQFEDIHFGEKFPYKYDRRHRVNAGLGYKISRRFDFSTLWTFSTGDVFSLPDQIYPDFDNAQQIINPDDLLKDYRFVYHYTQNNQNRTSPYHRLDAAVNFNTNKKNNLTITTGVYNIYGSPDQYVYELKGSLNDKSMVIENGNKTFDMTPYLSLTFKF